MLIKAETVVSKLCYNGITQGLKKKFWTWPTPDILVELI